MTDRPPRIDKIAPVKEGGWSRRSRGRNAALDQPPIVPHPADTPLTMPTALLGDSLRVDGTVDLVCRGGPVTVGGDVSPSATLNDGDTLSVNMMNPVSMRVVGDGTLVSALDAYNANDRELRAVRAEIGSWSGLARLVATKIRSTWNSHV